MSVTNTPWQYTDDGRSTTIRADGDYPKPIAEIWDNGDSRKDNASFIVRACNAHDALVSALETARRQLVTLGGEPIQDDEDANQIQAAVLFVVDEAIALAKGE